MSNCPNQESTQPNGLGLYAGKGLEERTSQYPMRHKPVPVLGIDPAWMQDLAHLALFNLMRFTWAQSVKDVIPSLQHVHCTTELGVSWSISHLSPGSQSSMHSIWSLTEHRIPSLSPLPVLPKELVSFHSNGPVIRPIPKCLCDANKFVWQNFGNSGTTRVASVKSYEKLLPRFAKPNPAISKTATRPWLAKASGITFKKGEKPTRQQHLERGMRAYERNSPADAKVREERGGGRAPGAGAQIPLQPVVRSMVE
ncbi:hypothetical protein DUI87_20751 [Hirundo rustica rustica]|uniref:Uncharacterized protein n=1 Tax=Hirundo rustica rustica TaxID=333673 RepID=A0A3M0JTL4_HIRRU|nr:hypothetical protein DUI87_20751 [Hirundo rustica rustica]